MIFILLRNSNREALWEENHASLQPNFKLLCDLGFLDPFMDSLQGVLASVFLQVAERQTQIVGIPGALTQRKFSLEGRSSHFHAGHSQFITPSTWSWACKEFAGWVAGIDDGLSWFFLELAVGSVVDDFQVGWFAWAAAADGGATFESLWICSIIQVAGPTALPTCCGLVAEGGQIVDMVSRNVGAGSGWVHHCENQGG